MNFKRPLICFYSTSQNAYLAYNTLLLQCLWEPLGAAATIQTASVSSINEGRRSGGEQSHGENSPSGGVLTPPGRLVCP